MIENAVLLLVALTSGYFFCVVSLPSRFYSAREVGHRLYFRAIFYACFTVAVSVLGYIVFHTLRHDPCGFEAVLSSEKQVCVSLPTHGNFGKLAFDLLQGEEGIGIVFGSLITAFVLSLLVNTPLVLFKPLNSWLLSVVVRNRDFERLVLRSLTTSTPILLTLDNGKVYVGWAVRAPDPIESREFVRVMRNRPVITP